MSTACPRTLAALTTLVLVSGCASGGASSDPVSPEPGTLTELTVVNDHSTSVRVLLLDGPAAIPLGSVASREGRTFRVDLARLRSAGPLRLAADPVGPSPRILLPPVDLASGQCVEYTLIDGLRFTTFRVLPQPHGIRVIQRRSVS